MHLGGSNSQTRCTLGVPTLKPDALWDSNGQTRCTWGLERSNPMHFGCHACAGCQTRCTWRLRVHWDLLIWVSSTLGFSWCKTCCPIWDRGGPGIRATLCIHFCLKILRNLNVSWASRYIGMATWPGGAFSLFLVFEICSMCRFEKVQPQCTCSLKVHGV